MSSWRDSATQQAQDDLDRLVNAALQFAQQMLDQHGEFFPYGIALTADGEMAMVAADSGGSDRPASSDVLATLLDGFQRDRASLRATATVSDVRLSSSDAIRVELEHRDGHAMAVVLPYTKKRLRRGS